MLMECSILMMGNTVKWQGGDINIILTKKVSHKLYMFDLLLTI